MPCSAGARPARGRVRLVSGARLTSEPRAPERVKERRQTRQQPLAQGGGAARAQRGSGTNPRCAARPFQSGRRCHFFECCVTHLWRDQLQLDVELCDAVGHQQAQQVEARKHPLLLGRRQPGPAAGGGGTSSRAAEWRTRARRRRACARAVSAAGAAARRSHSGTPARARLVDACRARALSIRRSSAMQGTHTGPHTPPSHAQQRADMAASRSPPQQAGCCRPRRAAFSPRPAPCRVAGCVRTGCHRKRSSAA